MISLRVTQANSEVVNLAIVCLCGTEDKRGRLWIVCHESGFCFAVHSLKQQNCLVVASIHHSWEAIPCGLVLDRYFKVLPNKAAESRSRDLNVQIELVQLIFGVAVAYHGAFTSVLVWSFHLNMHRLVVEIVYCMVDSSGPIQTLEG